jgi:hypothetical protein
MVYGAEANGSQLIVSWFEQSIAKGSIPQIIKKAVRKIDWIENVEDFSFWY